MDSAKVHQAVRKFLMKEIDGLLFHKDKSIVSEVFYFLSKNKMHLHFDLRQTTVSHIEKSLHPLNITIDKDSYVISGNTPLPPHWNTFKGTIDDYNVKRSHSFAIQKLRYERSNGRLQRKLSTEGNSKRT